MLNPSTIQKKLQLMLDRGSIHHQPCMSPYIVFKEALVHSHDSFHGRQSLPHHPAHHTVKSPGHGPDSWGFGHRPMGEFPGIPFGWLKLHSWLLCWGFKRLFLLPSGNEFGENIFPEIWEKITREQCSHSISSYSLQKKGPVPGSSREVPRSTLQIFLLSPMCFASFKTPINRCSGWLEVSSTTLFVVGNCFWSPTARLHLNKLDVIPHIKFRHL